MIVRTPTDTWYDPEPKAGRQGFSPYVAVGMDAADAR